MQINISIIPYALPPLLSSIITLGLGCFAFYSNHKSRANLYFFFLMICCFTWLCSFSFMNVMLISSDAFLFSKLVYSGVIFIPATYYSFINEFLPRSKRIAHFYFYIVSLYFMFHLWFTKSFLSGNILYSWGYSSKAEILHTLFVIYLFAVFIYSFYQLISHYLLLRSSNAIFANRIKYVLFAFAVALTGSVDFLSTYGVNYYPLGFLSMVTFSLITFYVTVRHKVLEIDIVFKKTIFYFSLVILLSMIYLLTVYVIHGFFLGYLNHAPDFDSSSFSTSLYPVMPLLGSLLFLCLGTATFFSRPTSSVKYALFFLCIQTFLWQAMWLTTYFCRPNQLTLFVKIAYVGITPLPFTFLHLIILYLKEKKYLPLVYLFYGISIILICTLPVNDLFIAGHQTFQWGHFTLPGPLFTYFAALTVLSLIIGVALLVRHNPDEANAIHVHYLRVALIFYALAATDFMQVYGYAGYPVGSLFFLVSCLILSYAILKHKLLDVKIIIRKAVFFTALAILISMIYLSLILLFYVSFLSKHTSPGVSSLLSIVVIAILFKPVEVLLHRWLEKAFFKGTISQISDQKHSLLTELQRQERLRSVGLLAAGMAHEIKNPLTSIKTFAEYLPKKYDDSEFRLKFSKLIVDEVDRISSIVQQLLDFAKPAEPELKLTNISEILDGTLSLLTSNLLKARVDLIRSIDPTLIVMADKNQLRQALLNLILNAIQSMSTGGSLTITAISRGTKAVTIVISDTGAGINKEHLPHIFDPFYTTKEAGTGLGLAIVHSIITKHGGKIDVQSTVGSGTTVTITLKRNLT